MSFLLFNQLLLLVSFSLMLVSYCCLLELLHSFFFFLNLFLSFLV